MTRLFAWMSRRVAKTPAGLRQKPYQAEPRRMIMSIESLSFSRRTPLATLAAAGALSLFLLATPSYARVSSATIQVPGTVAPKNLTEVSSTTTAPVKPGTATNDQAIRPFNINIPEEALVDLRRRILATRWPDRETVSDQTQGPQLTNLQELVRYRGD